MTAKQFLDANQVREAEKSLNRRLRQRPDDEACRTFLFELLCFSGQYDRAEKQLEVLAKSSPEAEIGATLYRAALRAERVRHETFRKEDFPPTPAVFSPRGTCNGKAFQSATDLDPDVGTRLEVFAAGAYHWIPFEHIASVRIEPPRQLRDTLWAPAHVQARHGFEGADLGEVLLPAIYPFSSKSEDESVWLGRTTAWVSDDAGYEFPVGQKVLLMDGEPVPLLEIRLLEFTRDETA